MKRTASLGALAVCMFSGVAAAQEPGGTAPAQVELTPAPQPAPTPTTPTPATPTPPNAQAAPAASAAPDAKKEPKNKLRPQFVLGIEGNRRVLFSLPFWAVGPTIGVSLRPDDAFALGLMLEHLRGESDLGLDSYLSRFRVPMQGVPVEWLKLGGALGVSYLQINRATNGGTIQRVGFLMGVEATFDAAVTDDVTLYVNGRAEMELLWGGAAMPGGTVGVGIKL